MKIVRSFNILRSATAVLVLSFVACAAMPTVNAEPEWNGTDPIAECVVGTRPVVILPGGGDFAGPAKFDTLRSELHAAGRCSYYVPYGVIADVNGVTSVVDSAHEIRSELDRIRVRTGSDQVDIVAHSLGALVAHYYVKFLGGAPHVAHMALLAPVSHGTNLEPLLEGGISSLETRLPGTKSAVGASTELIPALRDVIEGSAVITSIERGGITVPGVTYCVLATRNEQWNIPIEQSQFIHEPGVLNDVFEEVVPGVVTNHVAVVTRPETAAWVHRCVN